MERWREVKKRYTTGETLTSQSVEDGIARAVMNGMGIKTTDLSRASRAFGIAYKENSALWPRTLELLDAASRAAAHKGIFVLPGSDGHGEATLDVREYTKPDRSEIIEMYEELYDRDTFPKYLPITFARPAKGAQRGQGTAYIPVAYYTEIGSMLRPLRYVLKPPVTFLVDIKASYWLAEVSVQAFVKGITGTAVADRMQEMYPDG